MPKWREVLTRVMGGDDQLTTDDKAAILGVPSPSRRELFKFGGAAILGAAVLAACGDDNDDSTATTTAAGTGHDGGGATTMAPSSDDGARVDDGPGHRCADDNGRRRRARTSCSPAPQPRSRSSPSTPTAPPPALLTTPAIKDAATMFAGHHQMHLDALNGVITGAGGKAITQMNQAVYDALVKPAIDAAKTEADAVMLALELEEAAAQTYVFAGGALSTPALRSTIMTIGGVEARHAAVLRMAALGSVAARGVPERAGFFPGDNPLAGIDGALITS